MIYDGSKPIWNQVKIDEELREFIVLSPADVSRMTMEALKWPDPAKRLSDMLTERGRTRRDAIEHNNLRQREADAVCIRDVASWPASTLRLKTQPWVSKKEGQMRFAYLHCNDILEVIHEGAKPYSFETVEDLVQVWSVD